MLADAGGCWWMLADAGGCSCYTAASELERLDPRQRKGIVMVALPVRRFKSIYLNRRTGVALPVCEMAETWLCLATAARQSWPRVGG